MRLNLNHRFVAYLMVLAVLPLLAVGIISIQLSRAAIEDGTRRHIVQEVRDKAALLDTQMAQMEALIANVSGVEEINRVLTEKTNGTDTYTRLATQARIGYVLNNYLNLQGLISIDIFTLTGRHYHVGDTLDVGNLDTVLRDQLIQETLVQSASTYWAGVRPNVNRNSTHRLTLVAAHMITQRNPVTSRREPVALLQINYDPNQVRRQFAGTERSDDGVTVVLDGRNRFVYHPDAAKTGEAAGADMLATLAETLSAEPSSVTRSGVLVSRAQMRTPGWRVLALIPEEDLNRSARDIGRASAVVMLLSLVFVGFGAFSLLRRVVQPLRAITERFRLLRDAPQVRQSPLAVSGNDEIAELTQWFNAFLDNLRVRQQSEEKLQLAASVFSHSYEGIMIAAADGTIIDINEACSRITGYSKVEMVGQNPRILSSGRHTKEFHAAMWRSLVEQGHWHGEVWNRRKNGEIYAQTQNINAVRDDQGNTQHFVSLFSDITALKAHQKELEHIAHYDALTSLPNRMLLTDRLHQAITQVQRRGQLLAVAFLDLDAFKAINDRHGHEAGDQLLIALSSGMKLALREGDTLARLGGDEFVAVLLDLPDVAASVPMLVRLLAAAAQPVHFGNTTLQVSASLGVTFYPQATEVDADQMLRQADQAMYQAKLAGKNRYHVFDAELDRSVRGHHESVERIRRALNEHEFVLHYQPKVNMRSGAVIGAEALIRWQHPEQGLLLPGTFLPVIENHPLIVDIGDWVVATALSQIEHWKALGLDLPVSVNISAHELQHADFTERLSKILATHPDVRPDALELEVLETSALEDLARVCQLIDACRVIGVKFALDDFGTGYSSLTYLKRLPVAQLKIDQSFVRDMLNDPDDLAILEGVIGLAAAFRRQVIAEGVETVEHGAMLLQLGCDLAQGYGIAHAMPAQDLPQWVATWHTHSVWGNVPLVSRDDLPLLFAHVEHRAWIAAVGSFLHGKGEAPPLDPGQCHFGTWLAGPGLLRHGGLSSFAGIDTLHQQAHTLAVELCQLKAEGQSVQALARLDELHELRDALLKQLKELTIQRQ